MSIINKPEVSKSIAGFYAGTVVFVSVVFGVVFYFIFTEEPPSSLVGIVVLVCVVILVEGIMLWLLASLYRTKYILTETELVLQAPRLIGGTKRIPLETITSMERTLIPFGFRLFGASFYGGHYYIPGIGRAYMVTTNFDDGVLIKAANGTYVITPSNPDNFITNIEKNKLKAKNKT